MFVLRIEDTDVARSTDESVEVILDSLKSVSYTHLDVYKRQILKLEWEQMPRKIILLNG